MWPVMPGLVGIRSDRSSLRAEKRHEDSTPSRALIRKKGEGPSRPKVVELWCIQCRENTQVQGSRANKEGNMFIDNDAEWTLGKTRPLYCVRASLCRTCSRTTFVPVDSTIPFITPCRLRRFFADYGKYDTVVKESMLDTLISSRQAPRSSVARQHAFTRYMQYVQHHGHSNRYTCIKSYLLNLPAPPPSLYILLLSS